MRLSRICLRSLLPVVLALTGCAQDPSPELSDIPEFEDYIGGKGDTGYVGARAAEIESTLTGKVRVNVPGKTDAELATIASAIQANPNSWEYRDITMQVTEQVKYGRNALKTAKLNMNLEGGDATYTNVSVIPGGLEISYSLSVESLVKFKELQAQGLQVSDLVGRTIPLTLPLVPQGLFDRTHESCAADPDGDALEPNEVGAHNLFYYWSPTKQGCQVPAAELVSATYRIDSSLDAPTVYPEYDRLIADGRIDMGVVFGQIEHGTLEANDLGFIQYRNLVSILKRKGFRQVEAYPGNRGVRLERTYDGLLVSVKLLTPVDFADSVPRETSNVTFREAISNSEIFYYNGHAFYGSLTVLDDPSIYPTDRYMILFMDACWSYAYYTKQIFRNRATAQDPDGYVLTDVINNTEPGITGSEVTAAILYENIFKGAAAVYKRRDASLYSWNNLVKYMNDSAEQRARTQGHDPEIYGVSGVRTNRWNPRGTPPTPPTPPPASMTTKYENTTASVIPDNVAAGVSSVIAVPSSATGNAAAVQIRVQIEHTYIGDLVVTLEHAGRSVTLHNKTGGGTDNLAISLTSDMFASMPKAGDWTLKVVDTAAQDAGRLVSWSVSM